MTPIYRLIPQIEETEEERVRAMDAHRREMLERQWAKNQGKIVYTVTAIPIIDLKNFKKKKSFNGIIKKYVNHFIQSDKFRETQGIAILSANNFWEDLRNLCNKTLYNIGWNINREKVNNIINTCNENSYIVLYLMVRNLELKWEFPAGKVKQDENYLSGMVRELEEETGIAANSINMLEIFNETTSRNSKVKEVWYKVLL